MKPQTWLSARQAKSRATAHERRLAGARLRRRLLSAAAEPLEDRTLLTTVIMPPPAKSLLPGVPDPSFNQTGLATAQIGAADSGGESALQPDHKIVVAGAVTESDGSQTIAVVRYMPDGQLDSSFGAGGSGAFVLDPALQIESATAVAIVRAAGDPDDGDIVVAGTWSDATTGQTEAALVRLDASGNLDATFGSEGVVRETRALDSQGLALAIQPSGELVLGGIAKIGTDSPPQDSAIHRPVR